VGRRHIGNFIAAGVPYVAAADLSQDRLELAKEQGCSATYLDYNEALNNGNFDAVLISVPPHLHMQIAISAAEKGCHIFLEKPLAASLERTDELKDLCRKKDLLCFVGYCYRFIPSVVKMRGLIKERAIGDVLAARLVISNYLPDWHPWEDYRSFYMAKKEQGGGALLDESHGIDLLRWLLGEVKSVHAIVDKISELDITSDDIAALLIRFQSGVVAQAQFDLLGRVPRIQLELTGSEGTILWDRIDHGLRVFTSAKMEWEEFPYTTDDLLSMYTNEVAHFIECVDQKKQPLIDLHDSQATMRVLLAAMESSSSGWSVEVANPAEIEG
jgi:predicted dehydrogenase